ncbi:c-type cytochrome [Roseobacter sp. YSTF-M11]|uniref:C-type cytochrome n=1 Tax=Roseobacter insulae TaxID=2859783 RepID=A0A9X1K1A9_9RHOB|nr:c-type cytochrome [Roseobacter insulae]MBW4709019.1 c-type cytochrome [Roseobacter insulae]
MQASLSLPSMAIVAMALFAAASYSGNPAQAEGVTDAKADARSGDAGLGEVLYRKTCRACHGPTAKGMASYPKLRDQTVSYLVDKLERYRAGEKLGPNTALMAPRAKELSDEDILNISTFIALLE